MGSERGDGAFQVEAGAGSGLRPYYQDEAVTLFHGDCRDALPMVGWFNLLLTDPPYGHGERWAGGTWASNPLYDAAFEWDASTVEVGLLLSVVARAERAIVWGGNYYPLPPSRCWLAWVKSSLMPTLADFELAWTNLDRPSKLYREDRNPDGKRQHPTQKPLSVMEWCVSLASEPGDLIFDPFAGSGTTLLAAKEMGRRATGVELREAYCEIAARRLSQEVLDLGAA